MHFLESWIIAIALLWNISLSQTACLKLTDFLEKYELSFSASLLILDKSNLNQSYVTTILTNYPHIRDMHGELPRSYNIHFVHLANLIAAGINATLVSTQQENICKSSFGNFTIVKASLFGSTVYKLFNDARKGEPKPFPVQMDTTAYNYAYCNTRLHVRSSIFEIFLKFADYQVWGVLVLSATVITLLLELEFTREGNIRRNHAAIVATLCALLWQNFTSRSKNIQYSWLFILWVYTCIIFDSYYLGEFTSEIISPSPEFRLTRMKQLLQENFSLIFEEQGSFSAFTRLINLKGSNSSNSLNFSKSVETLDKLANRPRYMKSNFYIRHLSTDDGLATFGSWIYALNQVARAEQYLKENELDLERRCYVGKELDYFENIYMTFMPPRSEPVGRVFEKFVEAGFYQIWWKEYFGMTTARRVQDRSKIKGTYLILRGKEMPKPLATTGKLGNVFVVWILCLLGCAVTFISEIIQLCQFSESIHLPCLKK